MRRRSRRKPHAARIFMEQIDGHDIVERADVRMLDASVQPQALQQLLFLSWIRKPKQDVPQQLTISSLDELTWSRRLVQLESPEMAPDSWGRSDAVEVDPLGCSCHGVWRKVSTRCEQSHEMRERLLVDRDAEATRHGQQLAIDLGICARVVILRRHGHRIRLAQRERLLTLR